MGGFLSCVGILGFSSLGYFKKINHKYVQKVTFLLAMSILIILIMLFISKSRAGWLAFVVSGIFLIERRFYVFKNVSKKKKIAFLIMLIGFLLISMSFINIDSVRGRFFIWKNTLEIIRDNPLLGVGFDNFKTYYMDYQGKYFEENMRAKEYLLADDVEFAFNSWLQLTSENGIVGFVLVIYLVLLISKNNVGKEDLDKNLIVQTGLLCVGIFGLFSYPMQILPLKIIITVLLAYKSSMMSRKIKLASIQIQYPKATGFFGALVTLSLVFIVSNYLIGLDRGLKSWKHGLNKYRFGGYEISVKDFQNGYFYLNRNGDFLRHYGLALSKSGKPREAIKVLEKAGNIYNMSSIQLELGNNYMDLGCFEEAEKAYLKASSMVPNLFAPDFGLVKLYHMTNQNEKKQLVAKRMLTKEVKINSLSIEEMKIEVIRILSQ
ncbi:O-antigen ligase family protein [Maribacter luteus]|uniref:O-antigen ligase family protein n=1 Tax=Maribacter luteus TaxID=2594478 RepID=UPI002491FCB9|nr:O-antigen ligase family protein [Maribacter luteus]